MNAPVKIQQAQFDLFDFGISCDVKDDQAFNGILDSLRSQPVVPDFQPHHLFDAPGKEEIIRLKQKTDAFQRSGNRLLQVPEAASIIDGWKRHTAAQGEDRSSLSANSERVVLSLYDHTGNWSKPWREAGYDVYQFDIQDDPDMGDVMKFSPGFFADYFGDFGGRDIYAILAAVPCTDFASSGARHFARKDADGTTAASIALAKQTWATVEYFRPSIWAAENPVGRLGKLTGLPHWRTSFDPNHIGSPYTKKTLLWGRFNGDLPIAPVEASEGSKMHSQYGGKSQRTKNARSVTPEGFSYGFFMANNAHDHPILEVGFKYDRLDRDLLQQALDAGLSAPEIGHIIDDAYYIELDDVGAERALSEHLNGPQLQCPSY